MTGEILFFASRYRITQSRSFQLLEDWITDSEKTVAALVPPASTSSSSSSTGEYADLCIGNVLSLIRSKAYRVIKLVKVNRIKISNDHQAIYYPFSNLF